MTTQSTQSLNFNGHGYVACGTPLAQAAGTISLWLKANDVNNTRRPVSETNGVWYFDADGTGLRFIVYDGAAKFTTVQAISTGVWYHFAGTWDSSHIKLYVNGSLIDTVVASTIFLPGTMRLGGVPDISGNVSWNGLLDYVALWQSDIGATNIANLAAGTVDPATLTPTAFWSIEEGTGTTTADSSGNGYNGTFGGTGTTWSSDVPAALAGAAPDTPELYGTPFGSKGQRQTQQLLSQ